jgi:hypothetical protein
MQLQLPEAVQQAHDDQHGKMEKQLTIGHWVSAPESSVIQLLRT